jgi:hypothetical protein
MFGDMGQALRESRHTARISVPIDIAALQLTFVML